MPFSRTLRIRPSRHRSGQKKTASFGTNSHCGAGSGGISGGGCLYRSPGSSSAAVGAMGNEARVTTSRGTTLGHVKSTWSQLVSRCGGRDASFREHGGGGSGGTGGRVAGVGAAALGGSAASLGDVAMVKKRSAARAPSPNNNNNNSINNNNNNGTLKHPPQLHGKPRSSSRQSLFHRISSSFSSPATGLKAAGLLVLLTVVGLVVFQNGLGFRGKAPPQRKEQSPSWAANNGGWRVADEDTARRLDSGTCSIDRVSATHLDPERFEREFRYKRPVIVTFPNGARDWTDPRKWTMQYLKRAYGEWKINSGDSVEIVRRGGNGHLTSSLDEFLSYMKEESNWTDSKPTYYMFDRAFYKDTELPQSFRLPPYFTTDETTHDSIFFLGTSGTGVVFHKHADTWNAVVFGKKRWFLYPMTNTPPGGVYHGFPILDWYGRVYPNLTSSQRPLECTQQGGEILYLPEGFYHATINIGDTIAVALQAKQPTLLTEKLAYEVTALNKQLDDQSLKPRHADIQQKVINNYIQLHDLLPESSEVAMKLGEKYGQVGQQHRAVELLRKALDLDPYFVLAYTALGNSLYSLGRFEEAEAALTHAVQLSPDNWDVYKDYGMFLMKRARYVDAIPVLRRGTELNPALVPFWSYLKMAQERTGDMDGARKTQVKIDELNQRLRDEAEGRAP